MGTKGNMSIEDAWSVAVRLSVPPYPHDDPSKHDRGQPVLGLTNSNPNHFLTDVYIEKNKTYWSASDGVIAKITGAGTTLKAARRAAYKNVAGVKASGLQYRIDIGERVEADLKQLRAWRYI
jgi:phosphoribosylamine-glycine ligase